MVTDQDSLKVQLPEYQIEHQDMDDAIARLAEDSAVDHLQLTRLKKRKLFLKDEIKRLETALN